MFRTFLVLAALFLLAAPAVAAEATSTQEPPPASGGSCSADGGEALPDHPEPTPMATTCITPGSLVTCSGYECHTPCSSDPSCSPTHTYEYFRIYRNNTSITHCCTLNTYIGPYRQCAGGQQSWMSFDSFYKLCNCV